MTLRHQVLKTHCGTCSLISLFHSLICQIYLLRIYPSHIFSPILVLFLNLVFRNWSFGFVSWSLGYYWRAFWSAAETFVESSERELNFLSPVSLCYGHGLTSWIHWMSCRNTLTSSRCHAFQVQSCHVKKKCTHSLPSSPAALLLCSQLWSLAS